MKKIAADRNYKLIKKAGSMAHGKGAWFMGVGEEGGALGRAIVEQGYVYQTSTRGTSYLYVQEQEDGSVSRITIAHDFYTPKGI